MSAGGFREDWRHAADWEWLIRASEQKALLLNRKPIAAVRTHPAQLSEKNRVSGHEITEVAAVIEGLLASALDAEPWALRPCTHCALLVHLNP